MRPPEQIPVSVKIRYPGQTISVIPENEFFITRIVVPDLRQMSVIIVNKNTFRNIPERTAVHSRGKIRRGRRNNTVAVRRRGKGDIGSMTLEQLIAAVKKDIDEKTVD